MASASGIDNSKSSSSAAQPCNISYSLDGENSLTSLQTDIEVVEQHQPSHHHQPQLFFDSIESAQRKPQMEIEEEEMLDAVTFPLDEIPEPIKVLDEIISEFEDISLRPQLQNNGENQSEDDGYMSLSRKNMKEKRDSEEMSQTSSSCAPIVTPNESFDAVDLARFETNGNCNQEHFGPKTIRTTTQATTPTNNANTTDPNNLVQTTLPKARTATAAINNSNYSSLPCCGQRTLANAVGESKIRIGSCNGDKNALGIDISAVHKAVLRGRVAKLPEPILNEHPVTIYPGPKDGGSSGVRNSRPKRLQASVDKHKEICHMLNPGSTSISSSSSSSSPASTGTSSDNHKTHSSSSNNTLDKFFKNTTDEDDDEELSEDSAEDPSGITVSSESTLLTPRGIAWEIHFKDFKKKTKLHQREVYKKTSVDSKQGYQKTSRENSRHSQNLVNNEEEFRSFEESPEILNSCVFRQSSMLGKGTFIIRRGSTKKPPRVMDVFPSYEVAKDGLSESEPDVDSESERVKYMPSEKDVYAANDIRKDHSTRHSLDIGKPLTSPRDRLSLNLEPLHPHNSQKKDISPIQHLSKSALEATKKGSLKSLDGRTSSESINAIRTPCHEEAAVGFDIKSTTVGVIDPTNIFVYKQSTNSVILGTDFGEIRSTSTTPHTDLAPTLEEDEEQLSDLSYSCAPLKQIENNISALLRGEIAVARMVDLAGQPTAKRPLEFRPGVHKSESAKEMLLSQNAFGPLPPSPPSSNPDPFDYNDLPLPPSPTDDTSVVEEDVKLPVKPYVKTSAEVHTQSVSREELRHQRSKEREKSRPVHRHMSDELPLPPPPPPPTAFENLAPVVPPHRHGHSSNTMKSWSIDSNYKRKSPRMMGGYGSGVTTPTSSHGPSYEGSGGGGYGTRRYVSYGTKRSLKQSPREEHRLQTSCSLPETPIFARGCDIPRTPYRRQTENTPGGSRTAPRSSTSNNINMGNSIVGISGGNSTFSGAMCRQRSINHALASNEMLRLAGAPQRGWYPKQRSMRPASTENIDRIATMRIWDGGPVMPGPGQARKPLTLPPNLTPSFLNKSPREALRRVTSLLITKKKPSKDKRSKSSYTADHALEAHYYQDIERNTSTSNTTPKDSKRGQSNTAEKPKKKGIFKTLWKRTKHFSLDQ